MDLPFDGVVYQIYPRSFRDTSGNGIGDLAGVTASLDHLKWLGVDAVWLSPIYPSPMADFGYDVADYTDVEPLFGTLEDLDELVAEAHDRQLQVWLDWVPNHSSSAHPWFVAARSSREDPHRSFYIWRDPAPDGGPPNNWTRHFADEPAWTLDEASGQYYLHLFLPEQPDLNWDNPALRAAMHDTLRFWMRRGVDGFRADVVHLIGKDPAMPDDPPVFKGVPRAGFHHVPQTQAHLRTIRAVLDEFPDRVMVGEINLPDAAQVASYLGEDRLHLGFFFGLIYAPWDARSWRDTIRYADEQFAARGVWPAWALGNHDQPRLATRLGSEAAARAATTLLLGLRGVPFLYAGDELGLADAEVPDDRQVDPGGRDGCRAPIPWERAEGHGWAGSPWLPWPPEPATRSLEAQREDPASMLLLHRRLLALRRSAVALRYGAQHIPDVHDDVVAIHRFLPGGAAGTTAEAGATPPPGDHRDRLVLANLGDAPCTVTLPDALARDWQVELSTDGIGEARRFDGSLRPDHAVILVPADDPEV